MRTATLAAGLVLLAACKQGGPPAGEGPIRIDMSGTWKIDEAAIQLDEPCPLTIPHPEIVTGRFEIIAHPTRPGRFALARFLTADPMPGCGLTSIEANLNEGDGHVLDYVAPPTVGFPECTPGPFTISMSAVSPYVLIGTYRNSFGSGGLFFTFQARLESAP